MQRILIGFDYYRVIQLREVLILLGEMWDFSVCLRTGSNPADINKFRSHTWFFILGPSVEGSTLVVGGDGRFFMREAADIIVKVGQIIYKIFTINDKYLAFWYKIENKYLSFSFLRKHLVQSVILVAKSR